ILYASDSARATVNKRNNEICGDSTGDRNDNASAEILKLSPRHARSVPPLCYEDGQGGRPSHEEVTSKRGIQYAGFPRESATDNSHIMDDQRGGQREDAKGEGKGKCQSEEPTRRPAAWCRIGL